MPFFLPIPNRLGARVSSKTVASTARAPSSPQFRFVAVVTLAREGSGTGYFLEPLLIVCVPLAGLIAECRKEAGRRAEIVCLLGVSLLAGTRLAALAPRSEDFVLDRAAVDYLRRNFPSGSVGAGRFPGELIRAGLRAPISDIYLYSWLICQGTIPATDLLTQLEQRRIAVILVKHNLANENDAHPPDEICLKEEIHRAILQNYRLATTLPMPRPEQGESGPTSFYVWVRRLVIGRFTSRLPAGRIACSGGSGR